MRHLAFAIILFASALISGASIAADFGMGYDAYNNGDYATAHKEWRPLAEQGYALVQYFLGTMYYYGEGVPKIPNKLFIGGLLFLQGYSDAQHNLGILYRFGKGVLEDFKTAVYWYKLAAEQGHAQAQNNLGSMYFNGQGVLQDFKQAVYWFKLSAEQGEKFAQNSLGSMYFDGQGVLQDYRYAHMVQHRCDEWR